MYTIYHFFMIWGFDFLNQVGRTPGLLKLFSEKCVCVGVHACVYVPIFLCLSVCTNESKVINGNSSLHIRSKGEIKSD